MSFFSNNYNPNERKLHPLIAKTELKKNIAKFLFVQNHNNPALLNTDNSAFYIRHLKQDWKARSKTRFVKRCVISDRARGVTSRFRVGRTKLRELLQQGVIPGWSKASW